MGIQLKQINAQDRDLQLFQSSVADALNQLQQGPFFNGVVKSVTLSSGSNSISHGLGRQPQFWTLLDINANTAVWRTSWNSDSISLSCSTGVTVKFWVS